MRILEAVEPESTDANGTGELRLVAVGCVNPTENTGSCTRSVAIFSAILRQTSLPGRGIVFGRELLLFWIDHAGGRDPHIDSVWTGVVLPD